MRVLLADDHALLVEGLQNLLEAHGIEVAGIATNGEEARVEARRLKPDVILMDIRMPVCDGLTATRLIKAEMPEIKIVVLTTSTEDQDLFEAVKSGANGYLLKSMDAESLIEALHDAQQDIPPFAPGLAARLLTEFGRMAEPSPGAALRANGEEQGGGEPVSGGEALGRCEGEASLKAPADQPAKTGQPGPSPEEPLTARQLEVLALVAEGLSYKEVGSRVYLSPRTVKYHMAEIMRKLHLKNRAQVLTYAGAVMGKESTGDAD